MHSSPATGIYAFTLEQVCSPVPTGCMRLQHTNVGTSFLAWLIVDCLEIQRFSFMCDFDKASSATASAISAVSGFGIISL